MSTYSLVRPGSGSGEVIYEDRVESETLRVSSRELLELVSPPVVEPCAMPDAAQQALQLPIESPPLAELAKGAAGVAIITSDSTRAVPCAELLSAVMGELEKADVGPAQVTVVVALGVHRQATDQEFQTFLGSWAGKVAIENHRASDTSHLVSCGRTTRGNEVLVNRTVAEADLRIAFGQVEPHEYAGFTGGPKSILAGVSGEPSIRFNHSPEMLLDASSRPGIRHGNPIWEDMAEAAQLASLDFVVNVVLTPGLEVAAVTAGSLFPTHDEAIRQYRRLYRVDMPGVDADIVVTTPGLPLNRNLYQTVKAIVAAETKVREGGVIVVYAACHEGVGSDDFGGAYHEQDRAQAVISRLLQGPYEIGMDHALLLCRLITERRVRLVAAIPGVDHETLRRMFFNPHGSLQDAYETARGLVDPGRDNHLSTLIFPQPQKTVFR